MLHDKLSRVHRILHWEPALLLMLVILLACGVSRNPLQGKWKLKSVDAPDVLFFGLCALLESIGVGEVVEFRSDGKVIVLSLASTYEIMEDNRVMVKVPICGDVVYKYAVADNELTIQREGVTLTFDRE